MQKNGLKIISCFRYVKYVGSLFLNMLKCVIIPLVIPSLIAAIGQLTLLERSIYKNIKDKSYLYTFCPSGSMDLSLSGKVGLRAIVYYMATTVLAVILGIILVSSIRYKYI